ncbi:DUF4350 domain-containing protein [Compostibacter hankyongensis]|uniref:DUF4350 domain-containing protein n=1 Tax=Compostibacter hankyongensis TaxID=1007089 RepID=A0ABP8FGD9_9BACT
MKLPNIPGCFAALCMLTASMTAVAQRPAVVALDNYHNHEINKKTGQPFHYTWEDTLASGYSRWGGIFRQKQATLASLTASPDQHNLRPFDILIIVDPDTRAETADPHYITPAEADAIEKWVRRGGVLVLLSNDSINCEFTHFNILATRFGMHFNPVSLLHVTGSHWEMGALTEFPDHPVFQGVHKIYMKETSSLSLSGAARPVLTYQGHTLAAENHAGKGLVFAICDPWIYNEYIDHDHLTADFENRKAAENLSGYLLSQVHRK